MDIVMIRDLCEKRAIRWSTHVAIRMAERDITRSEVINAIMNGEIIEEYPNDYPLPSCLILGFRELCPLHVVLACDTDMIIIISVYVPDRIRFENDNRTRRNRNV